jgi:hypothetical protein
MSVIQMIIPPVAALLGVIIGAVLVNVLERKE